MSSEQQFVVRFPTRQSKKRNCRKFKAPQLFALFHAPTIISAEWAAMQDVGCQRTNKDCSNVATPAHVAAASHSAIQGDNILAAVDQAGFDRVSQRLTGPPNLLPELRGINTLPMPGFSGAAWNSHHSADCPQPPTGLYRSDLAAETSRMGNAPYGLDIDPRLWAPDHDLQHPQLGPEQGHATAFRSTECDHPFQQPSAVSQEEPVQDVPYVGYAERTVDNQESDDQPEVNN
ncbi:hypothetical protein H2202_002849 [Exophiala xenobiotica]|nr:hypothetical protein H2202_002849 [Exophiala xenobiotica]